ncbi:cofilin [Neurospora sp. IMI 360204]|nr:cofilin [Neurospora sp. IMI 360204]
MQPAHYLEIPPSYITQQRQSCIWRRVASGVNVDPECRRAFDKLMSRQLRYIIYKLSDDFKEIVIESTSEGATENYEEFRQKLVDAQTKSATVGPFSPR